MQKFDMKGDFRPLDDSLSEDKAIVVLRTLLAAPDESAAL